MSKVTQKGQVTIPREIRKKLRIEAGDEVLFKEDSGKVVLIKKNRASIKNLKNYMGYLSDLKGKDSDEIIDELRGKAS
ncbi:MAG: AbrB/MazE/SpoVT family DNA-binding domain-containing protein [bacterium]